MAETASTFREAIPQLAIAYGLIGPGMALVLWVLAGPVWACLAAAAWLMALLCRPKWGRE